jgi:hypothetical protein
MILKTKTEHRARLWLSLAVVLSATWTSAFAKFTPDIDAPLIGALPKILGPDLSGAPSGSGSTGSSVPTVSSGSPETCTVTLSGQTIFTGNQIKPEVKKVVCGEDVYTQNEISTSYGKNIDAGEGSVTITLPNGNELTEKFTIAKRPITVNVDNAEMEIFDAQPKYKYKISGTEGLVSDTVSNFINVLSGGYGCDEGNNEYQCTSNTYASLNLSANVNSSTKIGEVFTITNINDLTSAFPNYDIQVTPGTLTIVPVKISNQVFIYSYTQTYTGEPICPTFTIKNKNTGNVVPLIRGTDYSVTCADNIDVGDALMTIECAENSNCTGTTLRWFNIEMPSIEYVNKSGTISSTNNYKLITTNNATPNESGIISLSGGWYAVKGEVKLTNTIRFTSDAHLIIADGATLDLNVQNTKAIDAEGNLNIYGQSGQSGTLNAFGSKYGISCDKSILITGGKINGKVINEKNSGYGIYSRSLTINDGLVTANALAGETGIAISSRSVTINGGQVSAEGSMYGIESNILLSWTKETDYIKASSYAGTVTIAEGKRFKDDREIIYYGTLNMDQTVELKDQTLTPTTILTVTFVDKLNDSKTTVNASENGHVTAPKDPTNEYGYKFLGWYTTEDGDTKFDFDAAITTDVTVYAKWELSKHTITIAGEHLNVDKTEAAAGETVILTINYKGKYQIMVSDPSGEYPIEMLSNVLNPTQLAENAMSFIMPSFDIVLRLEPVGYAENIPYIDENGKTKYCEKATVLKNGGTLSAGGWYVVEGDVTMQAIFVMDQQESIHIILKDRAKLTLTGLDVGNSTFYSAMTFGALSIYSQSTGDNAGSLIAEGMFIAINLTVNGGSIQAKAKTSGDNVSLTTGSFIMNGGSINTNDAIIEQLIMNGGSINANNAYMRNLTMNGGSLNASKYPTTFAIAKGTIMDEDGNVYSGTLTSEQIIAIAGKTLVPSSFKGKFLSDVNIAVADIPVQKYADGKPVCPSVVVTDGKDTLEAGTDYTVVCSNNNAVTSATLDKAAVAQITGKGNYAGAIQKRFFIWNNVGNYAAVQVFQDAGGNTHAEIDGAYDGTDAVAIDEDFENVAVKFNRKFTVNLENGGFSTIMLPFDIEAKNLTGVKSIFEFAGVFKNNGKNAVGVNYVWCNATIGKQELEKGNPDCNELSGNLTAYTPYMVEMDTPTLGIEGKITLKPNSGKTVGDARKGNWVFRGTLQKDEWSNEDDDIKNGQVWTFAASASNGTSIGKFVQFEGQNSVNPFQAYLYNLNGKQLAGTGELGSMDIVVLADYIDYTAVQIFRVANGNKHAVIDGSYGASADEPEAVSIPADIEVNSVEMTREFPTGSDNAFSTTVLPFDVNTANVSGLRAVLRYNGIKNGSTISMKVLWAEKGYIKNKDGSDKEYEHAQMAANTPYLVLMKNSEFKLKSEAYPITLKQTALANTEIEGCNWVFHGTWKYKKWGSSCSTGKQDCDKETGFAYGFAASASEDNKIDVGTFVKVGEGAWIRPMRAYLVRKDKLQTPQFARANGAYVKRPTVLPEELPELMSIVIDGDGDENETTVIGQFNTRTGEFKMNYDHGKFDLKGRRVNSEKPNARGAYYGKKVLKK